MNETKLEDSPEESANILSSVSCSVLHFLPHVATSQGTESLSPAGGISPSVGIVMSKQQSQLLTEGLGGVGAPGVLYCDLKSSSGKNFRKCLKQTMSIGRVQE